MGSFAVRAVHLQFMAKPPVGLRDLPDTIQRPQVGGIADWLLLIVVVLRGSLFS